MEELLRSLTGTKIDLNCGNGCVFQGVIEEVNNGIVRIEQDVGGKVNVVVDKVVSVSESTDNSSRPGFIG